MFNIKKVMGYKKIPDSPYGVAVSNDKKYVFYGHNSSGGTLRRVNYSDLSKGSNTISETVVESISNPFAVTVVGDYVFYASSGGSEIRRSSVNSVSPSSFMSFDYGKISGMGTDGKSLFIVNIDGLVYRINISNKTVAYECTIPSSSRYDTFSVSTDSIFTTSNDSRGLLVRYSRASGKQEESYSLSSHLGSYQSFFVLMNQPDIFFVINPGGNPASIVSTSSAPDCITEFTATHSFGFSLNKLDAPSFISGVKLGEVLLTGEMAYVSWGASIYQDGSPVTYTIDFYDGSTWTEVISNVSSLSAEIQLPNNINTLVAKFRVHAIGSNGLSSEFTESNTFTVRKQLILLQDGVTTKTYKNGNWQTV